MSPSVSDNPIVLRFFSASYLGILKKIDFYVQKGYALGDTGAEVGFADTKLVAREDDLHRGRFILGTVRAFSGLGVSHEQAEEKPIGEIHVLSAPELGQDVYEVRIYRNIPLGTNPGKMFLANLAQALSKDFTLLDPNWELTVPPVPDYLMDPGITELGWESFEPTSPTDDQGPSSPQKSTMERLLTDLQSSNETADTTNKKSAKTEFAGAWDQAAIDLLNKGLTHGEIAAELHKRGHKVSAATVRNRLTILRKKLGTEIVPSRKEVIRRQLHGKDNDKE